MKGIKLFSLITLLNLSIIGYSQAGVYSKTNTPKNKDTELKWTVTLNKNGSFIYNFYRKHKKGVPEEENFYGKGTWRLNGKIINFFTNPETEINEIYKMDFTNTKARYVSKSPRNESAKTTKTAIKFYQSDLFAITGLELFKQ
ncbi:hypothetical protein GCM10022291_17560 [Postechiella marina]|uniref:Lipocalin-like domain-containing protein n=1 Tax=Postechiella marina TaxID=943941 RepID=A0ABP8C8H8_9FLAO